MRANAIHRVSKMHYVIASPARNGGLCLRVFAGPEAALRAAERPNASCPQLFVFEFATAAGSHLFADAMCACLYRFTRANERSRMRIKAQWASLQKRHFLSRVASLADFFGAAAAPGHGARRARRVVANTTALLSALVPASCRPLRRFVLTHAAHAAPLPAAAFPAGLFSDYDTEAEQE